MELLKPSQPAHRDPARESLPGFAFNGSLSNPLQSILEDDNSGANDSSNNNKGEKVHVAVGKSVGKTLSLLHWVFKRFGSSQVCLLHVHQPSPLIPTLLGKLPASQANAKVVTAHRREEREQTRKLLEKYLVVCHKAKVEASIVITECDQVRKGIVELVNRHHVTNLVMWAAPENCMKLKKNSSKVNYTVKNAPLFCEIWFVYKGKHIWTREASEMSTSPRFGSAEGANAEALRAKSLQHVKTVMPSNPEFLRSSSEIATYYRTGSWLQSVTICTEVPMLPAVSTSSNGGFPVSDLNLFSPRSSSSGSGYSSAETRVSSNSDSKIEEESLYCQLLQMTMEVEASRKKAREEFLKCRKAETEAIEAISKVKLLESANAHEAKLREEADSALRITIEEQQKLLAEREEITRELQRTMRNIALLDSHAQEANRRHDESAEELKLVQSSIASLRQEKQTIKRQKMEAVRWLERWRSRGQAGVANCNGFLGVVEELPELAEFSLSDLQTATCNFSESFKLGQSGYGCVYKGEMLGRTVAIKKLHSHNMQGHAQFQKEVQVLGKLQHPHLVTLLGSCPEAWSLVCGYVPNGSLQDCLFRKSNVTPLTWEIRARIIAEISSALRFLHSCKPERIVHGDLKPQNILLDSELRCKICEFGICRLVTDDTLYCPSFCSTELKGDFPYADPELHRTGVLTPKSDIYSFGVIILQLLTGRSPLGLVSDVRRTMSCGDLASILDPSAGEWPTYVARRLVDLALQFCELNSKNRPELTPVLVQELEQLHVSEERLVPFFFLCPVLQEIMHDPQVAADGFTYEGEAIREWLQTGHETSPMTNLSLDHFHLTPNYALRHAIQDWLCKP